MAFDDTFTATVPTQISETEEFEEWLDNLDGTSFVKIEATKEKILTEGLITSVKSLNKGLYEKKWNSGLRLYFAIVEDIKGQTTLLLLGSGKGNEQQKAIRNAAKTLASYKVFKGNIKKKD